MAEKSLWLLHDLKSNKPHLVEGCFVTADDRELLKPYLSKSENLALKLTSKQEIELLKDLFEQKFHSNYGGKEF